MIATYIQEPSVCSLIFFFLFVILWLSLMGLLFFKASPLTSKPGKFVLFLILLGSYGLLSDQCPTGHYNLLKNDKKPGNHVLVIPRPRLFFPPVCASCWISLSTVSFVVDTCMCFVTKLT